MRRLSLLFVAGLLTCGISRVVGQTQTPPEASTRPAQVSSSAPTPRVAVRGFLAGLQMPDVLAIVPVAPTSGDARDTADMALYRTTRSLQETPRWQMALSDDDVSTAGLMKAFRCALGADVTRDSAPLVTALVARANVDVNRANSRAKDFYKRPRPYLVEDAPVCVSPERKATLAMSFDYPSGHTALSWETALVLSAVAPERTTELLARARAFGESRVVCGVHNLSAVEAGWMTANVVFAAQQTAADFQQAIQAAKPELAALRQTSAPVDPARCATEQAVLTKDPF